jgi:hypothetical protein
LVGLVIQRILFPCPTTLGARSGLPNTTPRIRPLTPRTCGTDTSAGVNPCLAHAGRGPVVMALSHESSPVAERLGAETDGCSRGESEQALTVNRIRATDSAQRDRTSPDYDRQTTPTRGCPTPPSSCRGSPSGSRTRTNAQRRDRGEMT